MSDNLDIEVGRRIRASAKEAGIAMGRLSASIAPIADAVRRLAAYQASPEFRLYERRRARALARSRRNQAATKRRRR